MIINKDLFFLSNLFSENEEEKLYNILESLKDNYEIIEEWGKIRDAISIKTGRNFPKLEIDDIDVEAVKSKFIRRVLLSKVYLLSKKSKSLYVHYPLIELKEILELDKEEIFQQVRYLHDQGIINSGYADGGTCISDITTYGNEICEDKDMLFDMFYHVNIQINIDSDDDKRLENKTNQVYVSEKLIEQLKLINNKYFDVAKLIQLLLELNYSYTNQSVLSIALLLRSTINHLPPIFQMKSFNNVVNEYTWSKSSKKMMERLELSLRNIADSIAHDVIRKKEIIPSITAVDFRTELEILIIEVIKILRE